MCEDLSGEDVKELSSALSLIANEKIKQSKKKGGRGKGKKVNVRVETSTARDTGDLDDYLDFM